MTRPSPQERHREGSGLVENPLVLQESLKDREAAHQLFQLVAHSTQRSLTDVFVRALRKMQPHRMHGPIA